MGVKLTPNADQDALSACAVWMFDSLSEMPGRFSFSLPCLCLLLSLTFFLSLSLLNLTGNYSPDEFSENSPVRSIASFPQDLVMVGRAAVLIRGICAFFSIPWSVSRAWAPLARWKLYGVPLKENTGMQQQVDKLIFVMKYILVSIKAAWMNLLGLLRIRRLSFT